MTDEVQPTPRDEADLAAMAAENETEAIYVINRMDANLFDAAPDPVSIILAMGDNALGVLYRDHGGVPSTISVTTTRTVHEGNPVVEVAFTMERPKGWTAPTDG